MALINKTFTFLYEASKFLPADGIYNAIRSRMTTKYMNLNPTSGVRIKQEPRCHACGITFKNALPNNEILPVKKRNRFLVKHTNLRNCKTKYQILSSIKYNKYRKDKQILVKRCKLCRKTYKNFINKPGNIITTKIVNEVKKERLASEKKRKLKRMQKKKNREFSGLKKSAVIAVKKRALDTENNNNKSAKRLKTETETINLISPVGKKKFKFSTPETTNPLNVNTSTGVICLEDTPVETPVYKIKNLNDMFTPRPVKNKNNSVIVLSDSDSSTRVKTKSTNFNEAQFNTKKRAKKLKTKTNNNNIEPIESKQIDKKTFKFNNNKNVILVSECNVADQKKSRLNNLTNFLKNSTNTQKIKKTSLLQNFLDTIS